MTNFNSIKNSNKQKNQKEGENNMKNFNLNEENENINNNTEDIGNGAASTNEDNGIAPCFAPDDLPPIILPLDPTDPDDPRPPYVPTCRVVLFVGGLCDNGTGLDQTIVGLMNSANASNEFILNALKAGDTEYNEDYILQIDMSQYNPEAPTEEEAFDSNSKERFESLISKIVSRGKDEGYENKKILVSTYLNKIYGAPYNLDSIDNQKKKLIRIIDEFAKYDNVKICLVGHSQGGLVNLEVATERSSDIDQMISLATPYGPVYLANALTVIDAIGKYILSMDIYSFFATESTKSIYKKCVNKLCDKDYFDGLKSRWNNLSTRPDLTVITGTAGRVCTFFEGLMFGIYTPGSCDVEAFDGLVRRQEQKDISHATFVDIIDSNANCGNDILGVCVGCGLTTLDLFGVVLNIFNEYRDKKKTDPDLKLNTLPAFQAITNACNYLLFNTVDHYEPVPDFEYSDVFQNVYGGICNHGTIRNHNDTIGATKNVLSNL